jgi:hypothetical protein
MSSPQGSNAQDIMGTRNVGLEFDAGSGIPKWSHMHPLPIELICEHNTPALKRLGGDKNMEACGPYQDECQVRGGGECRACGGPSIYGFLSPPWNFRVCEVGSFFINYAKLRDLKYRCPCSLMGCQDGRVLKMPSEPT